MTSSTALEADSPLVSVVTPSYNQSEFIEETIASVQRQQYPNVEHIVVDGESTDGTVELLERYDDDLTWLSEPDDGQSDAVNKGFEMASGDVVGWLNSDDVFFDTGVLDRVVDYFARFDTDVVYGDMALLDADSDVLKLQLVPEFDSDRLRLKCFLEQPSVFFSGEVVERERLDTDRQYVMDYEFWLRLAAEYEFEHVSDVLSGDRNHSERKILNDREAMQTEAEELRREHGGPTGRTREWLLRADLVKSGVPRAAAAALQTIRLHRQRPDLSFDGTLRPLPEMLRNVTRPNRTLL